MGTNWKAIAEDACHSAWDGSKDFGQIVGTLIGSGFDGYLVDFRSARSTYYLSNGLSHVVDGHPIENAIPETFDKAVLQAAIRDAQNREEGYTYPRFCDIVTQAGCAGYLVTFAGKRVVYFGRNGDTHTEFFPGSNGVVKNDDSADS